MKAINPSMLARWPATETHPMKAVDPSTLAAEQVNELLTAVVAPRPIGWVSTVSKEGVRNLAPYTAFAPVCNAPPMLVFSAHRRPDGSPKRTVENLLETGEFVINLVERSLLAHAVETSVESPRRGPEKWPRTPAGVDAVTAAPCRCVVPPRVAESRVALECRLTNHQTLGVPTSADLILGQIVHVWIHDDLGDLWSRIPDPRNPPGFRPVGALEVEWYVNGEGVFHWPNPPRETDSGTHGPRILHRLAGSGSPTGRSRR